MPGGAFRLGGFRSETGRRASPLIILGQKVLFVDVDRSGVLPDVTGAEDAAGKLLEFSVLDRAQEVLAELRRVGDLIEGNPLRFPNGGDI